MFAAAQYIYIFPHISYQLNVTGKDHKILCLFIVIFGCDGDRFNISITTILIDSINNKKQKKLSRTTIDLCWPHQRINGIFPFCPIQAPLLLLNSVVCDADSRIVYRIWSIYIDRFFSNFFHLFLPSAREMNGMREKKSIAIFLFGRNLSVVWDKFWRWTVGMNAVQIGRDGKYYQAQYSHHYTTRRIYPFHLRHARVSNVKGNVWHVISVHCIILFCIN